MKKILITKRFTALLWALVLTLMPMSLMADENTPLKVTVLEQAGSFDGEKASNAFDGNPETKWCGGILTTNNTNAFVRVRLAEKSKLDYYYLYTGNDINYENSDGKQQRNPKEWKLYAKVNLNDEWTLISHVTDAGLPTTVSTRSNNYKIDAAYQNIEYNYLKFQILQVEQGTIFEVGEICFIDCAHEYAGGNGICIHCGATCSHEYAEGSDVCTHCGYEKPVLISFTVAQSQGGVFGEGPDKAINGVTTDRWCGSTLYGNPYIVLMSDARVRMDHYYLYTGNVNVSGENNHNPKEWKLYAKKNLDDASWVTLSHVKNGQLPSTVSTRSDDYAIGEAKQNTYYKFFKFEIISVEKGYTFEVGELCMMGRPCHHEYADNICTICGEEEVHHHNYVNGLCTKCMDYEPAYGEGTEASPYLIGNVYQLAWYRNETNNGRSGSHVKLTADIDMSAVCGKSIGSWVSIDNNTGTFDGDGHVLKNLYINDTQDKAGFFLHNNGVIKNLSLESGSVKSSARIMGSICAANIIRDGKAGQIINCFNEASVSSTYDETASTKIGGICGENWGDIERCQNSGSVSGKEAVGGICGFMGKGSILNCYNIGYVTSNNKPLGGICGYAYNDPEVSPTSPTSIKSCYNHYKGVEKKIVGEKGTGPGSEMLIINNNYYYSNKPESEDGSIGVDFDQNYSGEVTWRLNGSIDSEGKWIPGKTDGTQAWYQELDYDAYPQLRKTEGNTVYLTCLDTYSNKCGGHDLGELVPAKEPSCTEVGNIAYCHCARCKKYFDTEGHELTEDMLIRPMLEHTYNVEKNICTECGLVKLSIVDSSESYEKEGPDKAINGITTDKWCGWTYPSAYVVLKNDGKVCLDHYYLYTGNDILSGNYNRNPKEWKLYAKKTLEDEWTEISYVTDGQLPNENSTRSDDFAIEEEYKDKYYKYFKFEIVSAKAGYTFEVGELCLIGRPCHHEYVKGNSICIICGEEHVHDYDEDGICKLPQCEAPYQKPDGEGTMYSRYRIRNRGNVLWLNNNFTDTYLRLTADVTITEPIIVGSESTLDLDLNQHALTGEGIDILKVNGGVLNLTDEKSWKGKITKGSHGVTITNGGTFNMYGGNITECYNPSSPGAAVYVQDGYFNMYGGRITNNTGGTYGAGVYCVADAEGETNEPHVTLVNLEDPEDPDGKVIIISDNTMFVGDNAKPSNLAVSEGMLSIGYLKAGSKIGIELCTTKNQTLERVDGIFALDAEESDVQYFTPDKPYALITYNNGKLEITHHVCTFDENYICTGCGNKLNADCVIEYTATEKLSIVMDVPSGLEIPNEYDYTDKFPLPLLEEFKDFENWGEWFFGVAAIKHEYDETTKKGRIICNAPVTQFLLYTELRTERLTSITLPSTVEYIDFQAFYNNCNLTSITLLTENLDDKGYCLDFGGCNNLQEIIVPYNLYADYVELCDYCDYNYWYEDENGTKHEGATCDLLKSLLTLDDTKVFETQTIEVKADATLQRSFSDDGWYSLCLPFSVSVADSPFSQVAAYRRLDGDTYKFATVDNIEAGKAYIVKVDAAVANPTFKNVFITTEAPATDGDFIGVYSPTELGAGCKVIGSGTTVNPANPGTMKGFRAYFPASAAGAKAMYFSVDDGETTALRYDNENVNPMHNAEFIMHNYYNLNGQRVNANHKGIVIKNGKKTLSR